MISPTAKLAFKFSGKALPGVLATLKTLETTFRQANMTIESLQMKGIIGALEAMDKNLRFQSDELNAAHFAETKANIDRHIGSLHL